MTHQHTLPSTAAADAIFRLLMTAVLAGTLTGCRSAAEHRSHVDTAAQAAIRTVQNAELGTNEVIDVESPADALRRRLLLDSDLPYCGAASLGSHDLPDTDIWTGSTHLDAPTPEAATNKPTHLQLGLLDALQVSARNSRTFRSAKEELFRTALDFDLEQDSFRSTFAGILSGSATRDGSGDETANSAQGTAEPSVSRKLVNGTELSGRMAVDLVAMLTQDAASAFGLLADTTISIPLLRGAGREIAGEGLRQSEQDLLYGVRSFERFKRTFAVEVAEQFLGVLREAQQLRNVEENYKRLIASGRRARRLADAGRLPEFQYDQAIQDELRARTRWVDATQSYASRLDAFKLTLGLPPDADIELDGTELNRLQALGQHLTEDGTARVGMDAAVIPPADEPIVLKPPAPETGGPLEIGELRAVQLALDNRLDLKTAKDRVTDAQHKVHVAADALRAELTLLGNAQAGERRTSAASASQGDASFKLADGTVSGLLTLDLATERTAEAIAYRKRLLDLESAVREVQELEDQIKLGVSDLLRDLLRTREGVLVQVQAVALAQKRVRSTDMLLQAGRAQVRDTLDAQEALLSAQNAQTAALVSYRLSELALQRDLGLLQVSQDGLWKEFSPTENIE